MRVNEEQDKEHDGMRRGGRGGRGEEGGWECFPLNAAVVAHSVVSGSWGR